MNMGEESADGKCRNVLEIEILKRTILNLDDKLQRLQTERKEVGKACTLAENTWKAWKEAYDAKDSVSLNEKILMERIHDLEEVVRLLVFHVGNKLTDSEAQEELDHASLGTPMQRR